MEKSGKQTKKVQHQLSNRQKQRLVSFAIIIAAMAVTYFSLVGALVPKRYDIAIGAQCPETIYASQTVTDESATEALRERASQNAQIVYKIDDAEVARLTDGAKAFFTALDTVRTQAAALRPEGQTAALNKSEWAALLTDEQVNKLSALATPALDKDGITAVLAASTSELQLFEDIVLPKLTTALSGGLTESGLESVKSTCEREVNATTGLSAALKTVAGSVFDEYMHATYLVDETATFAAREAAAEAVEPVTIKKGEIIVEKGSVVTESKYAILSDLKIVRAPDADVRLELGLLFYVAVVGAIFTAFLYFMYTELFFDIKKLAISAVLIALTALIALLCSSIDPLMTPALIGIMLCALLVSDRMAIAATAVLAVTIGLMGGGRGSAILEHRALAMCVSILAAGAASIVSLKRVQSRGAIIASGAVGGAAAALTYCAYDIIKGISASQVLMDVVWMFGSSLMSALLVVGSLTIWENLFDIATTARLNELSNTNHPLLKRLMVEAPGTYQHSVMVAALGEGAAQSIGADALLVRVGGYFHDVGKLMRPLYFKENQKPNENIHDTLPPQESANMIIAHQKDGVRLLMKYKLPSAVIRIAAEHHGNSLMVYFFHKAQEQANGREINPKNFRYSGSKPGTKESAIVMLADSCEAAVRSLGDTDKAKVEEMVHKIVWGKMNANDNLLANAPLTLAEISAIERSFLKTFNGLMHDRIEYPELENKE